VSRLAAMLGKPRLVLPLAIAACVAAIAGCGSSDIKGTIPPTNAARLNADLTAVETANSTGDCRTAEASAQDFLQHVNELPGDPAGTELKDALRGAANHLKQLVAQPCAAGATGPTGQQTRPSASRTTSTTATTTTTPDTTATTTPTTTSSQPPTPPGGGNQGEGNNGGPGNQGGAGQGGGNPGGGPPAGGTGGTGASGGTGD
jgi:hypothetical protein